MAEKGRPTDYSDELAAELCFQISEGKSLRTICSDADMPDKSTVFRWLASNKDFRDQYAHAKEEAVDAFVEDILDIADDGTNDWNEKYDEEGKFVGWQVNKEHIQRSRVRIDTRKWIASKLKPKKYGDKLDVTSAGKRLETTPIVVSEIKSRNVATETEAEAGS